MAFYSPNIYESYGSNHRMYSHMKITP